MDIGIIGGGASAVCVVNALTQATQLSPGRLVVFEPSAHLWRGRAYQPDLDVVRLNTPPSDMSVRADDVTHFARWLTARDVIHGRDDDYTDPHTRCRFVPRAMYGDYLEQSAREAIVTLRKKGWKVDLLRDYVGSARPTADGIILRTAHGHHWPFHRVVLCFGAGEPPDAYGLNGSSGYVPDPYPVSRRLTGIAPEAEVAVIGSGLTAVDVVLALDALGHRGRVTLVSRKGVLPWVRPRAAAHHRFRYFTPGRLRRFAACGRRLTLADVVALLSAELADAGTNIEAIRAEIDAIDHEDPVSRLRRHLDDLDSAGLDSSGAALRILHQSLPEAGPDVWSALADGDKDFVLDAHYRTVMSLCCPMPPSSASKLLALLDSGRLTIARDVLGIVPGGSRGFTVITGAGGFPADTVINAMNARLRGISRQAAQLVASLVAEGLAEQHPRGGLAVERSTSRLTAAGRPDPRLYALGDPGMGSLFFTFGVPSLVDRAVDIVHALARGVAVNRCVHV